MQMSEMALEIMNVLLAAALAKAFPNQSEPFLQALKQSVFATPLGWPA